MALAGAAHGQYLMIPDSGLDKISLFSANDGSIVNADFILDASGAPYDFQTPKEAIQVGNEIWVSDQISDAIFCFTASLTPQYIRTISGQLDNIRGLGVVGNRVYVSNEGINNGAPDDAIVVFEFDGTRVGHFAAPDPFDCVDFGGQVLVPDIDGDDLRIFATDGTFVGVFHESNGISGIDFPEQLVPAPTGPGGEIEVWATGFTAPAGIYRYSDEGVQVAYYDVSTGARGVWVLGNGDVLFTESAVVRSFTPPNSNFQGLWTGGSMQFVGALNLETPPACDPDVNCDGSPDQGDVACMILAVAGDTACICQDPDFNQDGSADQGDVSAIIGVVAGQPCP